MFLYYFKLTLFDLHEPPTLKEQIKKRHKPSCWIYVHSSTNVGRPSPLFAFNIRGFFSFTGTPFLYDVFGLLRRRVRGGMFKSVLVSATFKGQCFALCQSSGGVCCESMAWGGCGIWKGRNAGYGGLEGGMERGDTEEDDGMCC